jgi:Zn-dependent protease
MISPWIDIAVTVIAAIGAIVLHEAAHGVAAWLLGDDTAKLAGRFSLNPLRHIDRVGTILLPGVLLISQLLTIHHVAFMFGWAKPVPVNAFRFRHPRQDMALVAAAGPLMNFVLAWLAALLLHATDVWPGAGGDIAEQFLEMFILTNLVLGLFNLLPIPPLDGGRIVVGVLPLGLAMRWAKLERAGIFLVLIGVFLLPQLMRQFGVEFDPVGSALNTVIPRARDLVLQLAGYNNV